MSDRNCSQCEENATWHIKHHGEYGMTHSYACDEHVLRLVGVGVGRAETYKYCPECGAEVPAVVSYPWVTSDWA